MSIGENYKHIRAEVDKTCVQCGRDPQDVCLLAVSKTVGIDGVEAAAAAGAKSFGENRPDQLVEKASAHPELDWHFIGNIQSRRIADIVAHASLIHSLYTEKHALKINEEAAKLDKVQDVLLEVNVSGEDSKSGLAPDEVKALLDTCLDLPSIRVRGLMTMAPQGDNQAIQDTFQGLAKLKETLSSAIEDADKRADFCELSMGMSEDWHEAIAQGSTIVRVGRAIFSDNFAE